MLKHTIRSPFLFIYIFFICINFTYKLDGGTCSDARFALMRAMFADHSFVINKYKDWTIDWAKTPDGNYYSSKAPGPNLLGFPVFYVMAKLRPNDILPSMEFENYLSIITQVVPFLLAVMALVYFMRKKNVPWRSLHLMVLLLLFGNSAALFMNTFFGHGFLATFIVLLCLGLYTKKDLLIGISYGFCLLSEYSMALFLPPLLLYLALERKNIRWARFFLLGGLVPGLLWSWYHISCFGSPFVIAAKYVNPLFQNIKSAGNLYNIFSTEFRWNILFRLLFGDLRGVLVTQPWVLFLLWLIPGQIFKRNGHKKEHRGLILLGVALFTLLLIMNTNYATWHGGMSPGPRFLSPAFVFLAFIIGIFYDDISPDTKTFLWAGALASFVVFASVYASSLFAPDNISLFEWISNNVFSDLSARPWTKFTWLLVIFAAINIATSIFIREEELFGTD